MKKQKNATRIIAIVLVALMALALIPIAASAEVPEGEFEITYKAGDGTGEDLTDVTEGQELTLLTAEEAANAGISRTGFTLTGWKKVDEEDEDRETVYEPGEKVFFTESVELTAVWTAESVNRGNPQLLGDPPETVTVTYNRNLTADDAVVITDENAPYNSSYTLLTSPAFADVPSGLTFDGWSSNRNGTPKHEATGTFTEATTLYARWLYTATLDGHGGTFPNDGNAATKTYSLLANYQSIENFTGVVVSRPGYKLRTAKPWTSDEAGNNEVTSLSYSAENTAPVAYAQWEEDEIPVHYAPGTGGGTATTPVNYQRGTSVYLAKPADLSFTAPNGQTFAGWKANSDTTLLKPNTYYDVPYDTAVTSVTFTAQYGDTCKVFFNSNGTVITSRTQTVAKGTVVALDALDDTADATFGGWWGDQACTELGPYTSYTANAAEKTFFAKWVSKNVTFKFRPGTGASGEMADQTAARSSGKFTLPTESTFTAPSGKFLSGWSIDGHEYALGAEYSFTASAPNEVEVTALWKNAAVTVTFNANTSESSPTENQTMSRVTAGTLRTVADLGFTNSGKRFKGWSKSRGETAVVQFADGESGVKWDDGNARTTVPSGDAVTLYALWGDAFNCTITLTKGGAAIDASTTFKVGDVITATVTDLPDPRPATLRWRVVRGTGADAVVLDGGELPAANTFTHTVTADDLDKTLSFEAADSIAFTTGNFKAKEQKINPDADEKATLTFTAVDKAAGDKVKVDGTELTFTGNTATAQIIKNASFTISLEAGSGRKVSAFKKGTVDQTVKSTYTQSDWAITGDTAFTVTFAAGGSGEVSAVVDYDAPVSNAVKAKFAAAAGTAGGAAYGVWDVVSCYNGDVTDKAPVPSDGLAFKLPYPAGSNKVPIPGSTLTKDISNSMTTYYAVKVWHYNKSTGNLDPVTGITANAKYADGVSVPAQHDFSDYGVTLTPVALDGSVTITGTNDDTDKTASVGAELTAAFQKSASAPTVVGTLSYRWQQADSATGPWTDIAGANKTTYKPDTVGKYVRCVVSSSFETGEVASDAHKVVSKPNPRLAQVVVVGNNGYAGQVNNVTSAMEFTRTSTSSAPGSDASWTAISGTSFNVGQSGYYWVRMKNDTTRTNWGGPVYVPLYYTVTGYPDSVSTNRVYFTATGDSGIIERIPNKEWLVPENGKINVTANSSNTNYYKINRLVRENMTTGDTTTRTFSKANSGATGNFTVNAPYYVWASAGVYGSKTGDTSHLDLWIELAALSAMGLGAALVIGRKKLKAQK